MREPGFNFKVNPLFVLVLVLFSIVGLWIEVITAFVLVLLHEFVHLIMALKLDYQINKIEIFPFGGMAEYQGLLEMEPIAEIKVALAGPVFNLLLAFFLYIILGKFNIISDSYTQLLFEYNLILGSFNLIPALPLDGGRVFRSIMVNKLGFKRGTLLAIRVAKILAVLGGVVGFIMVLLNKSNLCLLLVSFYIFASATGEKDKVVYQLIKYLTRRKDFIDDLKIKTITPRVVREDIYLRDLLAYLVPGNFNIFFIINKDREISGYVSEIRVLDNYFAQKNNNIRIRDIVND